MSMRLSLYLILLFVFFNAQIAKSQSKLSLLTGLYGNRNALAEEVK